MDNKELKNNIHQVIKQFISDYNLQEEDNSLEVLHKFTKELEEDNSLEVLHKFTKELEEDNKTK